MTRDLAYNLHHVATGDLANVTETVRRSWRTDPENADPNAEWQHRTVYRFRDSTTIEIAGPAWDRPVFPASPGCTHLFFAPIADDEVRLETVRDRLRRRTVLGWALNYSGSNSWLTPTTLDGDDDYRDACHVFEAIVFPDGHVEWVSMVHDAEGRPASLPSEDAWIEAVTDIWVTRENRKREALLQRGRPNRSCEFCGGGRHVRDLDDEIPF